MPLYFNNAFSKRPLEEVLHKMIPYLHDQYENPLTESEEAEHARTVIQSARQSVAALLNARSSEIVFVSSGTEANNWVLKGLAQAWSGKKDHVVISAIEHFSIYQTAQFLTRHELKLTIVPADREGCVDPDEIANAILPSTFVVSIQSASDEIGVIQNISAIAKLKERFPDVMFHTDAVQFLCYEHLDLEDLPFDLVSISSNALYGPSGIAALFIREGTRIIPLLHGGMQEDGRRPGLQSIANIAGFGEAARLNKERKSEWKKQLLELQKKLFRCFDDLEVPVTGSRTHRLVDNIHGLVDVDGEALLALLLAEDVRASTGSTCYEYAQKESHVLKALGIDQDAARGAILVTPSIDVTHNEIENLSDIFERSLKHLRELKPVNL